MHFNAVCERFTPHDTVFEIDAPKSLTDTKLSRACSLHTASGSTSSSTSSRKKRLVEIAEEDEDDQPPSKRKSLVADIGQPPKSPTSPTETHAWQAEPVTLNADLASSPEQSKFSADNTADLPTFVGADDRPSTADSFGAESSQFNYTYAYGKPKVKLGPRPSLEVSVKPQTPGNFRPVSAIPAGYKLFGKGSRRSKSKESNILISPQDEVVSIDFATAPTSPDEVSAQDGELQRPVSSAGSIAKSLSGAPAKKTISPEKARLMKAMQLREKKKKQQQQQQEQETEQLTSAAEEAPEATGEKTKEPASTETVDSQTSEPASAEPLQPAATEASDDKDLAVSQADSGIVIDSMSNSTVTDQTPVLTPSNSHPTSPTAEPSEPELSTKASSISESTDETVREKDEEATKKADGDVKDTATESITTVEQETAKQEPDTLATTQENGTASVAEDDIEASKQDVSPIAGDEAESEAKTVEAPEVNSLQQATAAETKAGDDQETVAIPISKFSTNNSTSPISAQGESPKLPVVPPSAAEGVDEPSAQPAAAPSPEDLLAATRAAAEPSVETPAAEMVQNPLASAVEEPASEVKDESDAETIPEKSERQKRRGGFIEPIQTDMPPPPIPDTTSRQASQAAFKTPVTPTFPRDESPAVAPPSLATTPHTVRTVSNPVRGSPLPPADVSQSSARSISSGGAAYLHKITQQQQGGGNLGMKPKVGSSISQRIKALEMLSASNVEAPRPVSRERPQSTFFSVKKSEPAKGTSVLDRANSLRQPQAPSEASWDSSPETSRPPRDRSGSISNRLSMFQQSPDARGKHESISVTAKIIRDPNDQQVHEAPSDLSGFNPLDLKQSPLFVNHQKAVPEPTATPPPLDSSVESLKDDKGRRSSMSLVKGFMKDKRAPSTDVSPPSQSPPQNNSFSPRLSFSSRRSMSKERETLRSPTGFTETSASGDDAKSTNGDGKMSRAGRFMRRLSTLSGSKSKSSIGNGSPAKSPPAVKESTSSNANLGASRPSTTGTSPWIVSYMGDVNVQFPDNLLWKRRNMCLDSQGFLVLSALPAQSSRAAQGTKRYHLSEFRGPYCPDVEVQELPNSVVLDFIEGTSLQLACEDRSGQLNVLNSEFASTFRLKLSSCNLLLTLL